jgi:transposase
MILQEKSRITNMLPLLNEKQKRLFLANEANALGYGGISQINRLTGVSRITITKGISELKNTKEIDERCRIKGGGRKKIEQQHPEIQIQLDELLDAYTKGDPENPLKYTSKSIRNIETELKKKGYSISDTTIAALLKKNGYSLQSNKKELALTSSHPDRDAQFEYIKKKTKAFFRKNCPVLSIDAKKKEIVGNYKNNGREYHKKKSAPLVYDHDFISELGKATPFGIYDIFKNAGFVNVTMSSDTSTFAVTSLKRWWQLVGSATYKNCDEILITADSGGSNGYRVHLWKWELQKLANKIDKKITVLHFPPGTSKWNKIEHRLFSFISKNWRGKPLINTAIIINLISSTKTEKGLVVKCVLDNKQYRTKQVVKNEDYKSINIKKHKFHGEWNYTISPQF